MIIFVSSFFINCQAQSLRSALVFSGKVLDVVGKPLTAATVNIADIKKSSVVQKDGSFRFVGLPKGKFLVEARILGYKPQSKEIELNGSENVEATFRLEESYLEEGEVVVTGVSKATLSKRNPAPLAVVEKEQLASDAAQNIVDAIAKVPGVATVSTGPNIAKPFIRGLGFNRILVLYDGSRLEGQQWGDEHGVEIDRYGIEKVEVVKGPASLGYGSDALAGVVNFIPTQPFPDGQMSGSLLMEHQTNNKALGGSLLLGRSKSGFEWVARASRKAAACYQNKWDGRVFGTKFNEADATLSVGVHKVWGYSHATISYYDNQQEVPDGSRDSATRKFTKQTDGEDSMRTIVDDAELRSYKIGDQRQRVQHARLLWSNQLVFDRGGALLLETGFQQSIRREYEDPSHPSVAGLYLLLNTLTYQAKYSFPETRGWGFSIGSNGFYQINDVANGTEYVIPSYRQTDMGFFALAKKNAGKWDWSGGLRFDARRFFGKELIVAPDPATGFSKVVDDAGLPGAERPFLRTDVSFQGVSGSLGVTRSVNKRLAAKANLALGYRAPNVSEISSNGIHPGTNIFQLGNTGFKPEQNIQADLGADWKEGSFSATASLFANWVHGYIYNKKLLAADATDSIIVEGNMTYRFQNTDAILYGGEMSMDFHPLKRLHLGNVLSCVYARNLGRDGIKVSDSDRFLPFIPPLHGLSEVKWDLVPPWSKMGKAAFKAQFEYHFAQDRAFLDNGTESPTPGYGLFNLGISGTLCNGRKKVLANLHITATNIFDVGYQDHLSRLKYFTSYPNPATGRDGIYNMGRNFVFKVDVPLAFGSAKGG